MTQVQTTPNNINVRKTTSKGLVTVDKVYSNEFQKKGTLTAQIRQTVTTTSAYPSAKVASNLNQNIFEGSDFGFEDNVYTSKEERVAWILIPEAMTLDQVKAAMVKHAEAGACIYRVLSNQPILDENQKYAVSQGLRTEDDFANSQVVRYPDTEETRANGTANKLLFDAQGKVQYRRTFFWKTPMNDHDVRGQEVPYISKEIAAEIANMVAEKSGASALSGQSL